jgi:uncharacterized membrane protein YoaK (UPF0700 family)
MTSRRLLTGLAAMAALFVVGAIIGGVWDSSDTAGAITVALWAIAIVGAALLLLAFLAARMRRNRPA